MAKSLGFKGHIAWAQAMIESGESSVKIAPTAIALNATLRLGTVAGVISRQPAPPQAGVKPHQIA